jgi:hypothetical protein
MIIYTALESWCLIYYIFSSCSKFHSHSPSLFLPNLHTKTFNYASPCSTLTTLSLATNNTSILGKKNLAMWWGDTNATSNHKSPIVDITSALLCNSIVKGSNESTKVYMSWCMAMIVQLPAPFLAFSQTWILVYILVWVTWIAKSPILEILCLG